MGQHSHQDRNPGCNASGLLETLPLHPREEWERYNVLVLNCKEHKWEMKMNSVEMVDELQDKAGSLSWSNTLVTPLGHYTCWGSFGFCFYSKSASPLQQHPGTVFFHSVSFPSPLEMKIDMTVPVTCLIKSSCTDKVYFFVPLKHQGSPPQPTNSDMFIEERKAAAIDIR